MLSQDTLERLVQPFIDRSEAINLYVIQKIAKRIKQIGELRPSDVFALQRLLLTGSDVRLINKEIARITNLQVREVKKLIRFIAFDAYVDAKPFFDYRKKPYIPFDKNENLQKVIKAWEQITAGTFQNISGSQATGFLIRDLKNPSQLKFQSIGDTYVSVIDEAVQAAQSGVMDYSTAMRRTMKQLVDSGVRRLSWESGYTQRLDSSVRRNLLDGVRGVNQGVQDEVGKQFGADGKEITVHANSAPDHEPVQGRQFTNEEYEKLQNDEPFIDVNGKHYEAIRRAIGTLNCKHFTYSIIVGVSKPIYTEEQLKKFAADNAKGYTLPNGKHLTMYECEQKQRQMETEVRKLKDGQMAAKESGDMDLAKEYQAKINQKTQEYNAFSKACGLSPKPTKMAVAGYKKISIK